MLKFFELLRGIEPRFLEYKSSTLPFMFQKQIKLEEVLNSHLQPLGAVLLPFELF